MQNATTNPDNAQFYSFGAEGVFNVTTCATNQVS